MIRDRPAQRIADRRFAAPLARVANEFAPTAEVPNDEPASQLLERIKARRAAAPKARRKRRVGAD